MIELIADPVESVERAWLAVARAIGGHIEDCLPCWRRQPCNIRDRLNVDEGRAFGALKRAREAQP